MPHRAIILVGGVISDGKNDQQSKIINAKLQEPRANTFNTILNKIDTLPFGFESKEKMIATYAAPTLSFGVELQLFSQAKMMAKGRTVHGVLCCHKVHGRSNEICFTMHTKGHQVHAQMIQVWTAATSIKRRLAKRKDFKQTWTNIWDTRNKKGEAMNTANSSSHGPAALMGQVAVWLTWKWTSPFEFTRNSGLILNLTEGEDGLFDQFLRTDIRAAYIKEGKALHKREDFEGVKGGIDYEAFTILLRQRERVQEREQTEEEAAKKAKLEAEKETAIREASKQVKLADMAELAKRR